MNVLLVSQCDKRALTETRRILDQFAERRDDRTWQTPITEAGLDTLRRLLRKTARKNTAVACHWIRGRDHSELMWIVGDARRFNSEGAVPTGTTTRDVLRKGDENDWHYARDIRLLAQLAALLHDLGKASVAFQQRLRGTLIECNRYRHEWVSLRLFLAFVGNDNDQAWLTRLASQSIDNAPDWTAPGRYLCDGVDPCIDRYPFRDLATRAPLAAAVGWLIVTHHRLPIVPPTKDDGERLWLGMRVRRHEPAWLDRPLASVAHDWNETDQNTTSAEAQPYWELAGDLPTVSPAWIAPARRVAKALLELTPQRDTAWLDNPFVMHLARLCLMLADHHYSSLGIDEHGTPVAERQRFVQREQTVFANTTRNTARQTVLNQSLLEHLLGVAHSASLIAHALPNFQRHLPHLANHRGLRKRTAQAHFAWQDKAFDAAAALRETAHEHGAFIVNMASTGCGKTLANARILYALADPQSGMRVSYALGLRTLTLQTGSSYRRDLDLGEDELAVLVGGSASRALFEHYEAKAEASGSASVQSLIEEDSHVLYEGNVADHPLLSRALANRDIRKLISAPMLVCTVDHLVPATESLRAGRQIAPMLRLMSSDLVLDELDDYDLDDLPALTRLVHWAGLFGARVLLSSATLPPALVEGMFMAYRAGRRHYRHNRGRHEGEEKPLDIACLWTDEFGTLTDTVTSEADFAAGHARFVERRVGRLRSAKPLRVAELVPIAIGAVPSGRKTHDRFAASIREACLRLHRDHAHADPMTAKRVSFGLVRMAHIDPIVEVARILCASTMPPDTRLHLCVYHARFPLIQRSAIEAMLDTTFNRRREDAVWRLAHVRHTLDTQRETNHLFVVLASPVCEVGRDWDADWAVAEPSSMRSLIQLAGRVQRHRRKPPATPNVLVFESNLKGIEPGNACKPVFTQPGFESEHFLLASHNLRQLLDDGEYQHLDAVARIQPRPVEQMQPRQRWIDLEQARIRASMLPAPPAAPSTSTRRSSRPAAPSAERERDYAPAAWKYPQAALSGVLPQQQPFRHDERPGTTLAWLPDEDDKLVTHRVEEALARLHQNPFVAAHVERIALQTAEHIGPWREFDLLTLLKEQSEALERPLDEIAQKFTTVEVPRSDQGWYWHPWLGFTKKH